MRSIDHAVDRFAKVAPPGGEADASSPGAEIGAAFVGDDFLNYLRQFGGRRGRQAADRHVGHAVAVEIGIPGVGGDLRFGAVLNVDARRLQVRRHCAPADGGVGCGARVGRADQQNVAQLVLGVGCANSRADVVGRAVVGHEANRVPFGGAQLNPGGQRRLKLRRADHDRVGRLWHSGECQREPEQGGGHGDQGRMGL